MKMLWLAFAVLGSTPSQSETGKPEAITITLSTLGSEIAFDQSIIKATVGKKIRLRFLNAAKPGSDIHHDVAVLKPGTLDKVLSTLQKQSYRLGNIKQDPAVIVLSKSLGPGEEQIVELGPLPAGSYPYACFMAGHGDMLGMKGTLIVSP